MWGGTEARNMASAEKGLPTDVDPGEVLSGGGYDPAAGRHLKWAARLGTITCGSPVVAAGRIFVGTNNGHPRDVRYEGDRGVLLCLDEATGKLAWEMAVPAVPPQSIHMFYPHLGLCSTPAVEGDRLYLVTNRCEAAALTIRGLAGGNEGPFRDEDTYFAPPTSIGFGPAVVAEGPLFRLRSDKAILEIKPARHPVTLGAGDADVVWLYDMINKLRVWPHDAAGSSVLVHGDLVFVTTCNGADNTHRHIPSPHAPVLAAFDKKTGVLVATDDGSISPRILEGSWSSPALARLADRTLVVLGGPDGVCYGFDASPVPADHPGEPGRLRKVWWCDGNPPSARYRDREAVKFPSHSGPSEIIATPVFNGGRVYVAIGQDTRHGAAPGRLMAIDPAGAGDLTDKSVWQYDKISRTLSTVSVADGLLYVADVDGSVHCLDAATGKRRWVQETGELVSGSTLVADGKVYVGTEKGTLWVLAAGPEPKVLAKVALGSAIYTTPVAANGVLYVAACRYLFAFAQGGR